MIELSNLLWLAGVVAFCAASSLLLMYLDERERAKRHPTAAQAGGGSDSAYGAISASSLADAGVSSTISCDVHHVC